MPRSRIVTGIAIVVFLGILAAFAGVSLQHGNTRAVIEPAIRWARPSSSSEDIERIHRMVRELGHFVIPGMAFAILVIGPSRRRPLLALMLCALFAVIDESLQSWIPGRSGSLTDIFVDISGAAFGYFLYGIIVSLFRTSETASL